MTGGVVTDENIERRLSKLESAVAVVQNDVTYIKKDTTEIITHVKEANGRLGKLETWQQRIIGSTGVIIFIIGVFGVFALSRLI